MNATVANLNEVRALANDITLVCYQTGMTVEAAGAMVEGQMDGTQPADLVARAVELARADANAR